ncbi:hypothetical protein LSCM1_03457 [Leishmania martiniquensis]|uniref:Uncharacterized protein n=1 Tax=Leishmania martiniquensis TaxID=1580590 RepID=A0A836GMR2_9TRYP|nr:hypothetical protein LSCM1_03457 [Leishmania martiniquensis]
MPQATLPLLAKVWFLATAPAVIVDSIFVLMRPQRADVPHPLAEVVPFTYWTMYAQYDRRYTANEDAFVVVQSWMNLAEVAMGVCALFLSMCNRQSDAIKLTIVVALMTLYKTVLYCLVDVAEGFKYTRHNPFQDRLTMLIAPWSLWIITPSILLYQCFRAPAVENVPCTSKPKAVASPHPQQHRQQGHKNHKGGKTK